MQKKKVIAIIGGGGAGLSAANALLEIHDVTLFEKESSLGGHAQTETLDIEGKEVHVDLGVELFTEKQAPNLFEILNGLDIKSYVVPFSFGATFANGDYWNNLQPEGIFWQQNMRICDKFHLDMHAVMHSFTDQMKRQTLGEFLSSNNYAAEFIHKMLFPMLTTISTCKAPLHDYSLTLAALSFSLQLLSFFQPTYWRKIEGGIGSYISKMQKRLGNRVKLGCAVKKVSRANHKVTIHLANNQQMVFDEVIFATHADVALKLLETPCHKERDILGAYKYSTIKCVLHSDENLLQAQRGVPTYCHFYGTGFDDSGKMQGSLTRNNNQLACYRDIKQPILVTYDPKHDIPDNKIYAIRDWKLPQSRPTDMLSKLKFRSIQGQQNTWYCGTDTSFSGHEGALLSGMVVAELLDAKYPFTDNIWAKIHFEIAKNLMGLYTKQEKISQTFGQMIFKISKKLNLHKSQASRVLLDMYA